MRLIVGLLCIAAAPAWGQGRITGVVTDSSGRPVSGAIVVHLGSRLEGRTDDSGRFRISPVSVGRSEITVRRIGYNPRTVPVVATFSDADTVRLTLSSVRQLETVVVSEAELRQRRNIEGFYQRALGGLGTFITREEILNRRPLRTIDLFFSVPGIRVYRARGVDGIRFNTSSSMRRDCVPMLWVDGQRAPGMEVGEVPVLDVEGIELYHGPSTTPMQFSHGPSTAPCGVVVVWTRPPPPRTGYR